MVEQRVEWSATIRRDDRISTIRVWAVDEDEAREKALEHIHLTVKVTPVGEEVRK